MNNNVSKFFVLICIIAISLSLLGVGVFITDGLKSFKMNDRVVTVKGVAEKDVIADLALWTLTPVITGNDLLALQSSISQNQAKIMEFFISHGFEDSEIEIKPLEVEDLMANSYSQGDSIKDRYIIRQKITLRTEKVNKISSIVSSLGNLLREGVVLSNTSSPIFLYNKLNDIKPQMLHEAVVKAQEAASEFAKLSGAKVGDIKSANQGVFQILPRDKIGYQSHEMQQHKKVRVVSTITFLLQ